MSRWTTEYKNHAIHETLEWLRGCISTGFDDIDKEETAEKRRLLKIISKHEEILKNIDPELVPFNQLNTLNSGLRDANLAAQINAYKEHGTVSNLIEANNLLSNQLTILLSFLNLIDNSPSSNHLKDLEKLIDTTSETLVDKKNELTKDLEKLTTEAEEKSKKLEELSSLIEQNKSEVNAHVTEWQNQFSKSQESRSNNFNQWRDDFTSEKSSEVEKIISKYKDDITQSKSIFKKSINDILSDGKEKHNSILELYELTAGDSVSAGYMQSANNEEKQADTWRGISIIFIVLTVIWMLFAYSQTEILYEKPAVAFTHESKDTTNKAADEAKEKEKGIIDTSIVATLNAPATTKFPWFKLFLTFSLSGVLLWGSAYAAQQSTKHRKNEKRTRWFALEVKAIDPFISSLDPAQRNELKKQLSAKIFGQFSSTDDDNTKVIDEHVFKTVADTLGSIISKIPR